MSAGLLDKKKRSNVHEHSWISMQVEDVLSSEVIDELV